MMLICGSADGSLSLMEEKAATVIQKKRKKIEINVRALELDNEPLVFVKYIFTLFVYHILYIALIHCKLLSPLQRAFALPRTITITTKSAMAIYINDTMEAMGTFEYQKINSLI